MVATMAADGTDLRVLAEQEDRDAAGSDLVAGRCSRYVPGPEDEAACRIGGAVPDPDSNPEWLVEQIAWTLIRLRIRALGRRSRR